MTTLKIDVDIVPGMSSPSVSVSQGDHESRTLLITLLNNGKKDFTIPAGATVEVRGTKPTGKGFNYPCTFNGSQVEAVVKDQMTAEPGRVPCEIVIESDGRVLSSANFDMIVERSALQPGTVASSDTFDSLARKVAVQAEGNLFANALKGHAGGEIIQLDDVSPFEHSPKVRVVCPEGVDPSAVTLTCRSKNLIPYPYANSKATSLGGVYEVQADGGIVVSGTPTGASGIIVYDGALLVQGECVFSISGAFENVTGQLSLHNEAGDAIRTWQNQTEIKINTNEYLSAKTLRLVVKRLEDNEPLSGVVYPQLEVGSTATDYQQYSHNTYTPNTDGTVEGVTSTSPTMTLSTDTEGTIIDCEYNRDLTAAIERIEAALFN